MQRGRKQIAHRQRRSTLGMLAAVLRRDTHESHSRNDFFRRCKWSNGRKIPSGLLVVRLKTLPNGWSFKKLSKVVRFDTFPSGQMEQRSRDIERKRFNDKGQASTSISRLQTFTDQSLQSEILWQWVAESTSPRVERTPRLVDAAGSWTRDADSSF